MYYLNETFKWLRCTKVFFIIFRKHRWSISDREIRGKQVYRRAEREGKRVTPLPQMQANMLRESSSDWTIRTRDEGSRTTIRWTAEAEEEDEGSSLQASLCFPLPLLLCSSSVFSCMSSSSSSSSLLLLDVSLGWLSREPSDLSLHQLNKGYEGTELTKRRERDTVWYSAKNTSEKEVKEDEWKCVSEQ